jgi:hypothetical protein
MLILGLRLLYLARADVTSAIIKFPVSAYLG